MNLNIPLDWIDASNLVSQWGWGHGIAGAKPMTADDILAALKWPTHRLVHNKGLKSIYSAHYGAAQAAAEAGGGER